METKCENLFSIAKFHFPLDPVRLARCTPQCRSTENQNMAKCNSLAPPISCPSFLYWTSKMAARSGRGATLRKRTLVAFRNQYMKYFFRGKLFDFCGGFFYVTLSTQKTTFHICSEILARSGKYFRSYLCFSLSTKKFYSPVVNK